MADAACAYDLDQTDVAWLGILNGERAMTGLQTVSDEQFERVVEELEVIIRFIFFFLTNVLNNSSYFEILGAMLGQNQCNHEGRRGTGHRVR